MLSENSIGNLSFQLQYNGNIDGITLQRTTEAVVERSFVPALQRLLERYSPEHDVIAIDQITCDINIGDDEIDEALADKIIRQLEQQLKEKITLFERNEKAPTVEMRFAETLLFYLENGYMPWWAAISSRQQLNELIIRLTESGMTAATINVFLTALKRDTVITRICNDFEDSTFWAFIQSLPGYGNSATIITAWQKDYLTFVAGEKSIADKKLFSFLYKKNLLKSLSLYNAGQLRYNLVEINERFIQLFIRDALKELRGFSAKFITDTAKLADKLKNEALKAGLEQIGSNGEDGLPGKDAPKQVTKSEDKEKPAAADNTEPVYINNSGLVIIAPYLGMFFKDTNVVKDDEIIDVAKAITLLHYMATGSGTFAEFEIALPKLLCGLDLAGSVTPRYAITEADIELVNELLNSVIANWPILKNTSIEGLRDTFLIREGKLTFKENGFHLKVQQNAVDVLLDHLPWNISMVKLPWMKNILYVDWM